MTSPRKLVAGTSRKDLTPRVVPTFRFGGRERSVVAQMWHKISFGFGSSILLKDLLRYIMFAYFTIQILTIFVREILRNMKLCKYYSLFLVKSLG